jgi:hypothetical protein
MSEPTTTVYLIRDEDPEGGYYAMSPAKPDLRHYHRRSVVEVRYVEVPAWMPEWAMTGRLPVDPDGSNDSTWAPWWAEATPVWTRPTEALNPARSDAEGQTGP